MKKFPVSRLLAGLAALLALASASFAQAQAKNPRIALVVGNSAYADQALPTMANDAGLMAQTLQSAGFEVIGARDLDEKSLRAALRDFLDKAAAAGPEMQAFVYLAGRGVQYQGENFFAPVDAQIARDADVPLEAVRLTDFTHALAATPGKARIIVLDAARANPYAQSGAPLASGLALADPEVGALLAYNASPDAVAPDEAGPYGVFAKTLAGAMREGGVSIEDVLALTRLRVNELTQGGVIPWTASKLGEPYFVFERAPDAPPPVIGLQDERRPIRSFPQKEAYSAALRRDNLAAYNEFLEAYPDSPQALRVRAISAARREAMFWLRSVQRDTPRAYLTYLKYYQRGPHAPDARRRLAILTPGPAPEARPFVVEIYDDMPPPPREEIVEFDRPFIAYDRPEYGPPPVLVYDWREDEDWRRLPPPPPPPQPGYLPVLAVAIPLIVGAIAYRDAGRRRGFAPPGAVPPPPPPPVPPPLPLGIRPKPAILPPLPASPAPVVKPLPSLIKPGVAPPSPQISPPPLVQPAPNAPPPAPAQKILPQPPVPSPAPAAKPSLTPVAPTPLPIAPTPAPPAKTPAASSPPAPTPSPSPTLTPAKPTAAPAASPPPTPTPSPSPTLAPAKLPAPPAASPPAKVLPSPTPLPTPSQAPAKPAKPKPTPSVTPRPDASLIAPSPKPLAVPPAAKPTSVLPKPLPAPPAVAPIVKPAAAPPAPILQAPKPPAAPPIAPLPAPKPPAAPAPIVKPAPVAPAPIVTAPKPPPAAPAAKPVPPPAKRVIMKDGKAICGVAGLPDCPK